MDFESSGVLEGSESTSELRDETNALEASNPEPNRFYEFLEEQGYKIDRNDAGSVASAIEDLKRTDAYEAAPPGIEEFERSLRGSEVEKVEVLPVDPERLERIAAWLRSRGEEFSDVRAEEPRTVVEAFKLQKALEAKDKALAGGDVEVDNFYDAPVGMEDDIQKLEAII